MPNEIVGNRGWFRNHGELIRTIASCFAGIGGLLIILEKMKVI